MKSLAKTVKSDFGKRLRAARERAGLNLSEFAEAVDVEPSTAYRWEAGSLPKRDKLNKILRILGTDVETLLGQRLSVPPTVEELLATVARQESRIRELELAQRRTIRDSSEWKAAEPSLASDHAIPTSILELLEQISPDNKDAWDIIRATALTVGKAKPPVKPRT